MPPARSAKAAFEAKIHQYLGRKEGPPYACPDVENSGTALAKRDQLPILERVLSAKKKRRADFFRRPEVGSDGDRDVLPTIVERGQGRPEGRPWPVHIEIGMAYTFPVVFQGFLSK